MVIIRTLWEKEFTLGSIPLWTCPRCRKGLLIGDKKTIHIIESEDSKRLERNDECEQQMVFGSFSGILKCVNPSCGECIQIIGRMFVGNDYGIEYDEYGYENVIDFGLEKFFSPIAFFPTLLIFPIHPDVPEEIKAAIIDTFKIYWIDISSCANKIRTVVELILDEQKIQKSREGKKDYILDDRIKFFKEVKPDEGEFMMAIKWVGNEGSHSSTLTKDDVLDAYEMLEHVTTKLYEKDPDNRLRKLIEKSKTINETKKPISQGIKKETIEDDFF